MPVGATKKVGSRKNGCDTALEIVLNRIEKNKSNVKQLSKACRLLDEVLGKDKAHFLQVDMEKVI
jgi:hypothetical protein